MAVQIGKLRFGETDAKNEVFQQDRYGISVFENAFQIPPGVDLNDLILGARFYISGQKGCGKTALLLHTKRLLDKAGCHTHIVLFKSGVSESERARLAAGGGFEILDTANGITVQYDYTINWLWFIYKNLLRLINYDDVIKNKDMADNLKRLFGIQNEMRTSTFGDLAISRVNSTAKASVRAGGFTGEINSEVEALKAQKDDQLPLDIIEICERYIPHIELKPRGRCLLFFDEIELFWNRTDQRERDLFLIRDLLRSVARVNRALGGKSAAFVVYASVRSEVLEQINRVGPEIARDVIDFGVNVNWNVKGSSDNQPILGIVEAKIKYSELESDQLPTEDVWDSYFPAHLHGKSFKDHLLDISMFKPRHIVSRLNAAKNYRPSDLLFRKENFDETTFEFSQMVWREIEEELLGAYTAKYVSNLKAILTGFGPQFDTKKFEERVYKLGAVDQSLTEGFETRAQIIQIFRDLYRVGAIGNKFKVSGGSSLQIRDRWSFRDMDEPAIDQPFIVHESLRKVFQLQFGS